MKVLNHNTMKKIKLFEDFLNEAKQSIVDYSNSKNKILVGLKTDLLRNMKERYDYKEDGDDIYFFDKDGKHFGTLFDLGTRYQELRHDGKLDDKGWLKESVISEAKDSTKEELMDYVETKYKIKSIRNSEDFDGQTGGIWIAADNEEELSGNKIFDYYNKGTKYKNGVLKTIVDAIEKKGWWFSWNDPGTIMIWPKN